MQAFCDFILVDGNVLSMANLVSFFGFCLFVGAFMNISHDIFYAAAGRR